VWLIGAVVCLLAATAGLIVGPVGPTGILNFMLTITHYLLPIYIVFKFFVLYTNLFTIKIYCQTFIIIALLRTIKSMIITPEIKITCTRQVLVFIMVLKVVICGINCQKI